MIQIYKSRGQVFDSKEYNACPLQILIQQKSPPVRVAGESFFYRFYQNL